jgi:hypothetical protein
MTLCIAALSRRDEPKDERIIVASDMMLSNEWTSTETVIVKSQWVPHAPKWIRMYSGDPTIDARVLDFVDREFAKEPPSRAFDIPDAFKRALDAEVCRKIEDSILSPFGMTREEFFAHGRDYFGPRKFDELEIQIEAVDLGTDFIITGFSDDELSLFWVHQKGVEDRTRIGRHAIGSGCHHAMFALDAAWDPRLSEVDLAYRVLEAKFRGERARGVGRYTVALALAPDGTCGGMMVEPINDLRTIWLDKGQAPVPDDARKLIVANFFRIEKWGASPRPYLQTDAPKPQRPKDGDKDAS